MVRAGEYWNPARYGLTHSLRLPTFVSLLAAGIALTSGCKLLGAPFLLWGPEPTKLVPAEYPYLENKRVAIVVWADSDTLFEFPHVRFELGAFVEEALSGKVKGVVLVPSRRVADLQSADPDWDREPPGRLGKELGADRVIMVELTQYTLREPESPQLLRAYVAANVKVYDTADPDAGADLQHDGESRPPARGSGRLGLRREYDPPRGDAGLCRRGGRPVLRPKGEGALRWPSAGSAPRGPSR